VVNVGAYVKTELITVNAATEIYKTKVSEALTTKHKEAELLTFQQPIPRQIREREVTKNATKLFNLNYIDMKTILDKINRVSDFQSKKTELGTHEIELALNDDLNKYVNDSKTFEKSIQEVISNFDNLMKEKNVIQKRSLDIYGVVSENGNKIISKLTEFEKQAKELGLDASMNPIYAQTEKTFEKNAQYLKKLDTIIKALNK
jgi:hypothetical protein